MMDHSGREPGSKIGEKMLVRMVTRVLVVALFPLSAFGASVDCGKSQTFIEQAICSDKVLTELDERLAKAYEGLLAQSIAPEEIAADQRDWTYDVRNRCQDRSCVQREYERQLQALASYAERRRSESGRAVCEFPALKLPVAYQLFAAGAYTGRRLSFQIDQSGSAASQMDVVVNSPRKPVVLMLGAYEPTIWNISWTPGTRIAAVMVSGYHRQALAGLEQAVPVLNSSHDNKGPCGHFYVSEEHLEKLNPLARRFFGREVDLVYLAKNGNVAIGEPVPPGTKLLTSVSTPPESFYDQGAPLAGAAGLEDAVRKGILRKATDADVDAWFTAVNAGKPERDVPPLAQSDRAKPARPFVHNGYVVLKPFTFPAGLYGAHMATFFVLKGVVMPGGNPGHSDVYDFNTLTCAGGGCGRR